MIKVFLAEDESIMRRGIKNNIPWEREGFEFAGEASDGELAYPMIRKIRPDILITDIKMPFMDGLELASLVKKELPDTKIIILSGYNEFDYAKKAISIGVTDYLLKPISSGKLLEAVQRVADIIREEREQKKLLEAYLQDTKEMLEMEKAKLFYSIVDNSMSTGEILEWGNRLELDLTASYYTVILLKIISAEAENAYVERRVKAEEETEQFLKEQECIYYFKRQGEGWFLLVRSEDDEEFGMLLEGLKSFLSKLIPTGDSIYYYAGVGNTVQRLRDVRQSFLSANYVFATRFFNPSNQILTEGQMRKEYMAPAEKEDLKNINISNVDRKLLEDFLKVGDVEEASGFLDAYISKVGIENYSSLMFRQYLMMDMYFCVVRFIQELGGESQSFGERFGNVEVIQSRVRSVEGVRRYMKDLFGEALAVRDSLSQSKYSQLMKDATRYVEQNFSNNEISLNTVASHVGISPSYFSTIFRQETGRTFIEYLTGLRMERAKELLRRTGKKTTEIAFEVGYKDSHYFSYIFKKTQGITPKDYRGGRKENENS